ncbi:MAG: M15 family metallopeptidase [Eudoraea sp.]|nr:M15 family metallopeptidase [Eudoraea sp.]
MDRKFLVVWLLVFALGCKQTPETKDKSAETPRQSTTVDSVVIQKKDKTVELSDLNSLADTTFVRLADYSKDFFYDLRYATENNFLKAQVYECAECYTRDKTAKALIAANRDFMDQGYRILFFDCYRPNSVQYKMWEIVPNPQYVANPVKGSVHNRGGAVDISLVNLEGVALDMGTDFDYFGKRAYHDNLDLTETILQNRKILKETMEIHGFESIRTEWWHYNYTAAYRDAVADFRWTCQ